jgi:hypothetical protein
LHTGPRRIGRIRVGNKSKQGREISAAFSRDFKRSISSPKISSITPSNNSRCSLSAEVPFLSGKELLDFVVVEV